MRRLLCPLMLLALIGCAGRSAETPGPTSLTPPPPGSSPASASYRIDGMPVSLSAGRAESQILPAAASLAVTEIFEEPVFGDLDEDGREDAALLLVHQTGGSGSFFYLAAARQRAGAWQGTSAAFLGDRIAPQELSVRNGLIIARYAEHRPGEPMASTPSCVVERYFRVEKSEIEEILMIEREDAPRSRCRSDMIRIDAPRPGDRVSGIISLSGQARGPWFFEGDFPLLVIDPGGEVVARHYASAEGPWMTPDWVPFHASIKVSPPFSEGWTWLVLKKDNPSDNRALDDEVRIPVFLAP